MSLIARKILLPGDSDEGLSSDSSLRLEKVSGAIVHNEFVDRIINADVTRAYFSWRNNENLSEDRQREHQKALQRRRDVISDWENRRNKTLEAYDASGKQNELIEMARMNLEKWKHLIDGLAEDRFISDKQAKQLVKWEQEFFETTCSNIEKIREILSSGSRQLEMWLAQEYWISLVGDENSWCPKNLGAIPSNIVDIYDTLPIPNDKNRRSALMAALSGDRNVPKSFRDRILSCIEVAAHIDMLEHRDIDGNTLLAMAVTSGDVASVERLVTLGANPLSENARGFTPAKFAVSSGSEGILFAIFGAPNTWTGDQLAIAKQYETYAKKYGSKSFKEKYLTTTKIKKPTKK